MDAEPDPGESDGELPGLEQVRSSDPSREAGVQHPEGVQAVLQGAPEGAVPVHLQGVPPGALNIQLPRPHTPQTYPWIKNEFGLDFYK